MLQFRSFAIYNYEEQLTLNLQSRLAKIFVSYLLIKLLERVLSSNYADLALSISLSLSLSVILCFEVGLQCYRELTGLRLTFGFRITGK